MHENSLESEVDQSIPLGCTSGIYNGTPWIYGLYIQALECHKEMVEFTIVTIPPCLIDDVLILDAIWHFDMPRRKPIFLRSRTPTLIKIKNLHLWLTLKKVQMRKIEENNDGSTALKFVIDMHHHGVVSASKVVSFAIRRRSDQRSYEKGLSRYWVGWYRWVSSDGWCICNCQVNGSWWRWDTK